jgi:hypothetical protein
MRNRPAILRDLRGHNTDGELSAKAGTAADARSQGRSLSLTYLALPHSGCPHKHHLGLACKHRPVPTNVKHLQPLEVSKYGPRSFKYQQNICIVYFLSLHSRINRKVNSVNSSSNLTILQRGDGIMEMFNGSHN